MGPNKKKKWDVLPFGSPQSKEGDKGILDICSTGACGPDEHQTIY